MLSIKFKLIFDSSNTSRDAASLITSLIFSGVILSISL